MEFELKYQNAIRELKTYACCKENPGAPEVVTISKIVAWMCSGAHLEEELLCKAANRSGSTSLPMPFARFYRAWVRRKHPLVLR